MSEFEKKRGRPRGAKTNAVTPAMKIAREYVDLRVDAGMRPTKARRVVAGNWQVTEETVRSYVYRHSERLAVDFERELRESLSQLIDDNAVINELVDPDTAVIGAMRAVWSILDEVFDALPNKMLAAIAGLESEEEIRARLTEVMRAQLMQISEQVSLMALTGNGEPNNMAEVAEALLALARAPYFEAFAEAVKPRDY